MPLYEYKCNKCAHRFEKIEKVNAPEIAKCPKCGAKAPRMASAPAIQFKGTGWYVTDYARASNRGAEKSDAGGDSGKSDSKAETKTDAKTEAKTTSESQEKKKW